MLSHRLSYPFSTAQSFFTIYRSVFSRLQAEEAMISDSDLPSFGTSHWPWAPVNKGEELQAARTFYSAWINFSTAKEFSWEDQWNISEAPDRRVRRHVIHMNIVVHCCVTVLPRLMERDNKKARDDARRIYNDTVRVSIYYSTTLPILNHT